MGVGWGGVRGEAWEGEDVWKWRRGGEVVWGKALRKSFFYSGSIRVHTGQNISHDYTSAIWLFKIGSIRFN